MILLKPLFQKKILASTWPVLIGGLVLGTMLQLNWIHAACSSMPFFGAEKVACQDNLIRMLLGGPVLAILLFALSIFEIGFLLKKHNFSLDDNINQNLIFKKVVTSYYPLLGLILLPAFGYNSVYLWCVVVIFLVVHVLRITDPKLSPEYGEATFEITSEERALVRFIGKCIEKNENSIYQTIVECLGILPDVKGLQIDVDSVTSIDKRVKGLIQLLTDGAHFHALKVSHVGPEKYLP